MEARVIGETLVFEGWRFDPQTRLLFRRDLIGAWTPVSISSRALDILALLLERPGTLVSKDTLMATVWPDTTVEANNLTVQISSLRHTLDKDRPEGTCIQTVSGRGYRFVVPVVRRDPAPRPYQATPTDCIASGEVLGAEATANRVATAPAETGLSSGHFAWRRHRVRLSALLIGLGLATAAPLLLGLAYSYWPAGPADRPRLSLVVLPFENLSSDPGDDYLAAGITDDVTTDLSHISGAFVVARESASTYKGKPADVRKIGAELGVRYVIEGSVRRIGSTLRVNVQLASGETGADLWSDRFDEQISELVTGQGQIVTRMRVGLGISMVEIEKARSLRERPTNPDAFDLVLQARAVGNRPPSLQRSDEQLALYERALSLDPSSVPALAGVAFLLMHAPPYGSWRTTENMQRVESLLIRARAIAPDSEQVLNYTDQWLRRRGRFQEAMAVAEELIQRFPNNETGYFDLAQSKIYAGHAEEAIPLSEKAIRLNPRSAWLFNRYADMGFASLMLGRDRDAITFLERSLAINPDDNGYHQWIYRFLAAAYARSGLMPEAKHALAEADRLWPYDTVRMHCPDEPSSQVYAEQIT